MKDRPYHIEARKNAFAAARLMINEGKSQKQAAKATGSNLPSISNAMLILSLGTEQEIAGAEAGILPIDKTADSIRARTTPEQRKAVRRGSTVTEELLLARQFESEIYQKLRDALENITGLPSPKDTAVIVRKNLQRLEQTNRKLLAALEWIQEFSNEITL